MGKHTVDTVRYLQEIVAYFEKYFQVIFTELVGDFIKDENNVWWLTSVRAF